MKQVMLLASEDMSEILRDALDDKYTILPCSDPDIGGALLGSWPDVLILDLFLPGTDGLAFLRTYAKDLPPVVMVLTRFISEALLQELTALGVSSVIRVPCTPCWLRDLLSKY